MLNKVVTVSITIITVIPRKGMMKHHYRIALFYTSSAYYSMVTYFPCELRCRCSPGPCIYKKNCVSKRQCWGIASLSCAVYLPMALTHASSSLEKASNAGWQRCRDEIQM